MDNDIEALKRQLQQLKQLHDSGALGDDAYAESRQALEQRLVGAVTAAPAMAAKLPRKLLAGVSAAIVVLAVLGYGWTGSPQLASRSGLESATAAASAPQRAIGPEQIAAMVDKLAQRMKENPGDAEGWSMLGRSYVVLGRHADAVEAYKKALALNGSDAQLLADYADALAVANGRNLEGEPMVLVGRALKLDPVNLKALSLAGTAAFAKKDYAAAAALWERVIAAAPPDSPYLPRVQASIDEARQLGGLPPSAARPAAPPAAAPGASISGTVTLAAALRAKAAPDDTVFVFARAAEGPRMPLAMLRKQVKDLPFAFTLDDSTAMSPQMKLSAFPRVVIAARISKAGNAVPQPGDLAGQSAPVALGASGLQLEISQVVDK